MFSFKNLGHYVAVAARDIVKFGKAAQKAEPLIEAATALVYPPAVVVERAASTALGLVIDAADKVDSVSQGAPITIQLAQEEIADFKALGAFFKSHALANGVALPASK